MSASVEQRLEEIRTRLAEYNEHYSDPYDYDLREITAIRELENNAPDDIGFLLGEIERLKGHLDAITFHIDKPNL